MKKYETKRRGVLFVYDALRIGGCERVITVLIKEFLSKGIPTTILLIKRNIIEYDLPSGVKIEAMDDYPHYLLRENTGAVVLCNLIFANVMDFVLRINSSKRDAHQEQVAAARGLWKLYARYCGFIKSCFQNHPDDIIISFMDNPNFATLLASRHCRNPIIISERSFPGRDDIQPHFKHYRNRLYEKADLCVFQSEGAKAFFSNKVNKKSVIIENPIEQNLPLPYKGERRKEIITFCRLDRQKNLSGFIRAFAKISNRFPEYTVSIYGKGDQTEALYECIKDLKLEDHVFLRPHNTYVHELVKEAAMFVSFSDYEGLSNSMLEAMAIGMPVVCSDCPPGGARAMINNGENGLLVPVRDEDALANAMEFMLTHSQEAAQMGAEAANIRNRCAPEQIAEQWLDAIRRFDV